MINDIINDINDYKYDAAVFCSCRVFHEHTESTIMAIFTSKTLLCENKKSSNKMYLIEH